eukprot:6179111-Pleurochrysis_carterae.AAC.1
MEPMRGGRSSGAKGRRRSDRRARAGKKGAGRFHVQSGSVARLFDGPLPLIDADFVAAVSLLRRSSACRQP